jgi:hypothetical protein
VTGGWRKMHNEELHNLCSVPDILVMIKSRIMRNEYQMWVRKPKEKKPLGRPRHRWGKY